MKWRVKMELPRTRYNKEFREQSVKKLAHPESAYFLSTDHQNGFMQHHNFKSKESGIPKPDKPEPKRLKSA